MLPKRPGKNRVDVLFHLWLNIKVWRDSFRILSSKSVVRCFFYLTKVGFAYISSKLATPSELLIKIIIRCVTKQALHENSPIIICWYFCACVNLKEYFRAHFPLHLYLRLCSVRNTFYLHCFATKTVSG